jgi:hypothetical protein
MRISEVTRRDIFDALSLSASHWAGRLENLEFLSRLFDLKSLPSRDHRYHNAYGDIVQHTINNDDWQSDWIFYDDRFNLLGCEDETLLRFLCETVHPIVRPDVEEAERLIQMYNSHLKNDGFQIIEKMRISGKPVFVGRHIGILTTPGLAAVSAAALVADSAHVSQQITRMEAAVESDPALAIGTSKELVESCCKTILSECGVPVPDNADLPQLVKLTTRQLKLTPEDIPDRTKASDTIKRLLSNLATITQGIAALRNQYGTGHGKHAGSKGLEPRHAKLAVGAASTLAVFLVETHYARRMGEANRK